MKQITKRFLKEKIEFWDRDGLNGLEPQLSKDNVKTLVEYLFNEINKLTQSSQDN